MKSKSEKEKLELKKRLARILRVSGNKVCADCPEKRPTWISFIKPQQNFALGSKVLASFVCLECAGLHRKLGTHICVVRSISHDQFDDKDVDCADYSGNEVVNEIFEGHLQKSTMDGINIKPPLGAEIARRERFIRQKYVDLYFYRKRAHYQHIAEVKKMISNGRKPKSPGSSKSSPSKASRKKISLFRHNEVTIENEKDAAACSTTVANTTMTPTNTSRTRTISDRDDSNNSGSYKRRDKKRSKKRSSSKKDKSSKNRKQSQKKSSSKRRLKSKDLSDDLPKEGGPTSGEMSVPQKQPNSSKDLQKKNQTKPGSSRRNSKENNDLSGMILVFDEDSTVSFDSPKRERKRSSRSKKNMFNGKKHTVDSSINQNDQSKEFVKKPLAKSASGSSSRSKKNTFNVKKQTVDSSINQNDQSKEFVKKPLVKSASGSSSRSKKTIFNGKKQTVDISINQNDQSKVFVKKPLAKSASGSSSRSKKNIFNGKKQTVDSSLNQNDQSKEFVKKPVVKSASECCDSKDQLGNSFRDVRRSRSEITIDEITKKRDLSISPGNVGKHPEVSFQTIDRFSIDDDRRVSQMKSDSTAKLNTLGETCQLKSLHQSDTGATSKTSCRNLMIPYLGPSPISPTSVGGIVSEETSYGFGENTIHNMSGTGESNLISNLEDNSTEDGFRIIDSEVLSDRSSSFKCDSWEDKGSFVLPLKNKKAIDGAIKNQSGRRYSGEIEKSLASLNMVDEFRDIYVSNRSVGNRSNRSGFLEKSNRSMGNKSSRSIMSVKSNTSIDFEEVRIRKNPQRSKSYSHGTPDESQSNKKQSSKRRSKNSRSKTEKSDKKLNRRNQALLEEWRKLNGENQKKFVEFDNSFLSCA